MSTQTAMFGAGCFWGVEITFRNVPGVTEALVGYSGGHTQNPTYREVCNGDTNHAEVVYVEYDPEKVTYSQLLDVFFENHNPTQLNYQGPDHGTQYRSAIFTYGAEQETKAKAKIAELTAAKRFAKPIVTVVEPAQTFYKGEEYHQRYLEKRGLASCHV
ncbi:MAG: peptide-methionine (S)-S-oxide reductase MsrA [Armatimonadetes bacterium]|nr:peptide-methionine (S)-S-oxide reductase MsrA [Armatimonadota bacterium]